MSSEEDDDVVFEKTVPTSNRKFTRFVTKTLRRENENAKKLKTINPVRKTAVEVIKSEQPGSPCQSKSRSQDSITESDDSYDDDEEEDDEEEEDDDRSRKQKCCCSHKQIYINLSLNGFHFTIGECKLRLCKFVTHSFSFLPVLRTNQCDRGRKCDSGGSERNISKGKG